MKYFKYLLVLLLMPITVLGLEVESSNYIMYDLEAESVVMEEGALEQVNIASLTKIVTTMVALENIENLYEVVEIPSEGLEGLKEANASVVGFYLGQRVSYLDLLYGLMLPSGADAAQTLAYYIAGSNEAYVEMMNDYVKSLKLEDTHFINTTGLHDEEHYSTVTDVAVILMDALENETFRSIFTESTHLTYDQNITMRSSFYETLTRYELDNDYMLGAKTGFTNQAGYCLASLAVIDDKEYILVSVGAPTATREPFHVIDHNAIYEEVDKNYQNMTIFESGDILASIDTIDSSDVQYNVKAVDDYIYFTDKNTKKSDFSYKYVGEEPISYQTKEEKIGIIQVIKDDRVIEEIDVLYDGSLSMNFITLLKNTIPYLVGILIGLLVVKRIMKKKYKKS